MRHAISCSVEDKYIQKYRIIRGEGRPRHCCTTTTERGGRLWGGRTKSNRRLPSQPPRARARGTTSAHALGAWFLSFPIVAAAQERRGSEYVKSCGVIIRTSFSQSWRGRPLQQRRGLSLHFYYQFHWAHRRDSLSFPELHFWYCCHHRLPAAALTLRRPSSSSSSSTAHVPRQRATVVAPLTHFVRRSRPSNLGGQSLHHPTRIQRGGARTSFTNSFFTPPRCRVRACVCVCARASQHADSNHEVTRHKGVRLSGSNKSLITEATPATQHNNPLAPRACSSHTQTDSKMDKDAACVSW